MFIAIAGDKLDGHDYIQQAIDLGAVVIIYQKAITNLQQNITYIQVEDTNKALGHIACAFFDYPSTKLKLIGVTGTNGKTTVVTLLFKLFSQLGYACGLLSTVQNKIKSEIIEATHTTPDAIQLNELLAKMVEQKCAFVFMECSSHAIHQQRIAGLYFTGAIFTNLTHDHLDYHQNFENYLQAKKYFFDNITNQAFAITNIDDENGYKMIENTPAKKYTYSINNSADFKMKIIENNLEGLFLKIQDIEFHARLVGEFNAYNLMAVYATAICLGEDKNKIITIISNIDGAEGRFECLLSKLKVVGIIDYAHTPDALENVLTTIQKIKKDNQKIITVLGCGGNRDKTKRPIMLASACKYSDQVIVTSDNPRNEAVEEIIQDMYLNIPSAFKRKTIQVNDRHEAIMKAVKLANAFDIILIAGKGHEKYQEIKGVKYPFDDKKILSNIFNEPLN